MIPTLMAQPRMMRRRQHTVPEYQKDFNDVSKLIDKHGKKSEEIDKVFQKAIKEKDIRMIKYLLHRGIEIDYFRNMKQTALHFAYENQCYKIVDYLLSNCKYNIDFPDQKGLTHLHIACIRGYLDIVKRFIANKVDVNVRIHSTPDDDLSDFTPLHFAVKYANLHTVEALVEKANPNAIDHSKRTPLHLSCCIPEIIGDVILREKHHLYAITTQVHDRAIVLQNYTLHILKLLVNHKSNVNAKDARGEVPLTYIFRDNTLNYVENKFTKESLDYRVFKNSFSIAKRCIIEGLRRSQFFKVKHLLANGADATVCFNNDESILHRAIKDLKHSRNLDEFPEPYFDDRSHAGIVQCCLKSGARVNKKNKKGESPLQLAVSMLSAEIVEILLDNGANLEDVKFGANFFCYPNVLPSLEAIDNLIRVVELLQRKNYAFSLREKLIILQFLICNNRNCVYANPDDGYAHYKLSNLFEFGTMENITRVLNDVSKDGFHCSPILCIQITKFLLKLKFMNLSINPDLKHLLKINATGFDKYSISSQERSQLKDEAEILKNSDMSASTKLKDIFSIELPKILSMPSINCYKKVLLSNKFEQRFPLTGNIIKGSFARILIRKFVIQFTSDHVRRVAGKGLPDHCCEKIVENLNNDDIWSLCVAATIPSGWSRVTYGTV